MRLLNQSGLEIASGYVTAQGDWMTEDFVQFEGSLNFTARPDTTGTLILEKDNPSGLPQHDDELRVPVKF